MEIHELNTFTGTPGAGDFLATDNGTDTAKIAIKTITDPLNTRIDNIIAGPASSAQEVVDARLGADGVTYPSLGDAIRGQVSDLKSDIVELDKTVFDITEIKNKVACTSGNAIQRNGSWKTINIPNGEKYQILISSNCITANATVYYYLSTDNGTTYDDSVSLKNGQISDIKTSAKSYNAIALYVEYTKVIATGYVDVVVSIVGDDSLQNQITALDSKIAESEEKSNVDSRWLYDIYASKTNNILDVSSFVDGYYISRTTPYIDKHSGYRMSRFIYVKDLQGQSITVSGYTAAMSLLFLSDAKLDNTANIEQFNLNTPSRTVTVPSNAKYALVSFRNNYDESHDYSDMKIGIGSSATTAIFAPKYIGNPLYESVYVADKAVEYENVKAMSEYAPLSVGAPSGVSFDQQYERTNILFFSDSHIDMPSGKTHSLDNVKNTISFLNDSAVDFDVVIHGGDVITGTGIVTQTDWINNMKPFFDVAKLSEKPFIFSVGNHDTNDWSNTPTNAMDDTAWGTAWFDWAETNMGIVRQTKSNTHKSTWHYYDISDKKIRVISLDIQDTDKTATDGSGNVLYNGSKAWYISQEQMTWFYNVALNFDDKAEKDWGVIVVIHQIKNRNDVYYGSGLASPYNYESAIPKLIQVCKAFNTQTSYTPSPYTFDEDSFYDLTINADFTRYASEENKPYFIAILTGHEHFDREDTIDGINIIWVANNSCVSQYSDSRLARIAHTTTQNCFNLMSIDSKERKIRVVRYGAGKNCFGEEPYSFMTNGLSF